MSEAPPPSGWAQPDGRRPPTPSAPPPASPASAPGGPPSVPTAPPAGLPHVGAGTPPGYYPQEAFHAGGWTPPDPAVGRRRRRRVLLVAAGVVAVLVVVGGVVGVRAWLDRRPLGEVTAARTATVAQLDVGHCVEDLPEDGEVVRVRVVPCDEPHAAEVVAVHTLEGDAWPGQRAVDREVAAACEMDTAQAEAGLRPVVWAPSERSWASGDRRGLCLAWSGD